MSDPDRNEPLSDELEGHAVRRGPIGEPVEADTEGQGWRLPRAGDESPDEAEGHIVRRGVTESDDEDTEGHRVQRSDRM
jgi:hypothetical protein